MEIFSRIGAQITLRDWKLADLPAYRHWGQPGRRWQKLDGPNKASWTPEDVAARIDRLTADIESVHWPTPRRRVVIARTETDQFLGTISWYWRSPASYWLEIGMGIYDPAQWGKGLGQEALGLWCTYLWEAFPQMVRLGLNTWSGNRGMMRVAEKLGFAQEACIRKARLVDGAYYDSLGYGILREEWDALYPHGFG